MAKRKKKKRGLVPRSAGQYDNKTHGKSDSSMPPDDRTVKTSLCRVTLMRPKFYDGPMYFRPWGALAFEDPELIAPGRKSAEARGQSHWMVRVPVAKYVGLNDPSCETVTFCTRLPWDREAKRNNPYSVLYYAAKDAHDAGKFGNGRKWDVMWNKILVKGKGKGGAELTEPTACWFAQGIVYANGDKDFTAGDRDLPLGMDENDDLVVIQMSTSAGSKILDILDRPKKSFDGDADERPWEAFRYGDATGIYDPKTETVEGGVILVLFNPDKTKSIKKNTTWDPDAKSDSFKGYEAAVRKSFTGADGDKYTAELREQDVDNIFARSQFWFDDEDTGQPGLIFVPSVEEQCVMLAKAFRSAPKLLQFAWADREDDFLTDDVMGILNARKSSVMPGDDEEDTDDDDEDAKPAKRGARKDPTQAKASEDEDDEFEDDDDDPAAKSSDDDDEFEDEDDESETEDTDDDEFEDEDDESEDEDEDEDDEESKDEVEAEDDEDDGYPDDADDDEEEEETEEEVEDDDAYFEEDEPQPESDTESEAEIDDDDAEEAKMRASLDVAKKRGEKRDGKNSKKKGKAKAEKPAEEPTRKKKKKKASEPAAEEPTRKKKKKKASEPAAEEPTKKKKKKKKKKS